MTTIIYRAAIWTSDDGQREIVLTSPEESRKSDEDLLTIARREAAGEDLTGGSIVIDDWIDHVTASYAVELAYAGFARMPCN